jgi:hypothetical protein
VKLALLVATTLPCLLLWAADQRSRSANVRFGIAR